MANVIEKGLRMCLELVWVWRRDLEPGVAPPLYDLFLRLEVCLLGTPKSTPGHEQLARPRPPHARPTTGTAAQIQTAIHQHSEKSRPSVCSNPPIPVISLKCLKNATMSRNYYHY